MSNDSKPRTTVIVHLITILAVGAVAAALLVGFFFDGDFAKAYRAISGGSDGPAKVDIASAKVQTTGEVRLDGRCVDQAIADKARSGALFNSKRDAEDRCRTRVGGDPDVQLSLKVDDAGEVALEDIGGRCIARVAQTWTCLYDGR
ncbi:MAG: hypothetical protein GY898_16380 [Proteobacteria bacterium]|nr:hypothetical protein [Pseudomonadota bacterium]